MSRAGVELGGMLEQFRLEPGAARWACGLLLDYAGDLSAWEPDDFADQCGTLRALPLMTEALAEAVAAVAAATEEAGLLRPEVPALLDAAAAREVGAFLSRWRLTDPGLPRGSV